MKRYKGTYAHQTDIGRVRIMNEDQANVLTDEYGNVFLIVCDGMGGSNKGDYASRVAINTLCEAFTKRKRMPAFFTRVWLLNAVKAANRIIFAEAEKNENYKEMGTTLVCVLIEGEKMTVANVGDSRAYAYNQFGLVRLTEDQTYVDYLYRTGQIQESEKKTRADRHVLMNALGIFPSASCDIKVLPYTGQTILLCSDGLYNNVSESEIRAVLATDDRADQKVSFLISDANGNGGSDNIGIALWEANRQ